MNTPQLYNSPVIVPPVPCDDPTTGKPSGHSVPVCYPHTDRNNPPTRRYKTIVSRPLPENGVKKFGRWITGEKICSVKADVCPSKQAQILEEMLTEKLNECCPLKTVKLSSQDKPFINFELKNLHRLKQREYVKKGKSKKYDELSNKFEAKFCSAAEKFMRTKIDDLKETAPGKAYTILKNMGAQPGDCTDSQSFSLPNHQAENLSDQESAERIEQHFANISNEYKPLDLDSLPERVRNNLASKSTPPHISEHQCYEKLVKANKPRSGVPGDLPAEMMKEFSVELSGPLYKVYNNIVQSASWPQQWKIEYVTPIGTSSSWDTGSCDGLVIYWFFGQLRFHIFNYKDSS